MRISEKELQKWRQTRKRGWLHFVLVRCGLGLGCSCALFVSVSLQLLDGGKHGFLSADFGTMILMSGGVFIFWGLVVGAIGWEVYENALKEKEAHVKSRDHQDLR